MTIGPEGGSLILDAKVLNKDAGFVTQGQSVAVKLAAFPFTRYGAIPGTVERLGSDVIEGEKLGLVYPIRDRRQRAEIEEDGKARGVTRGRAAKEEYKIGRRAQIGYQTIRQEGAKQQAGQEHED